MKVVKPMNIPLFDQFLQVESSTGRLLVVSGMQCTYGSEYVYNITVSDSGRLKDFMKVKLSIKKCPHMPLITKSNIYTATVREDVGLETFITQITCNIPNSSNLPEDSNIVYNISDSESPFEVNKDDGRIHNLLLLDYETQPLHIITVTCYYLQSPQTINIITVYVHILPINEHDPVFEGGQDTVHIREDALPSSAITVIKANDLDSEQDGEVMYSIGNNQESPEFVIDSVIGDLYLVKELDRELIEEFSLLITATDSSVNITDRRSSIMTVLVVVEDINDHHPTCSKVVQYVTILPLVLDESPIATLECSDYDQGENSTLSYYIEENGGSSLSLAVKVETNSGEVYLTQPVTTNSPLHHTLSIAVSDRGVVPLFTMVYISIAVDLSRGEVLVNKEDIETERENEGWRNNATVSISNTQLKLVC